jgi:hypothetical protein
LIDPAQMKKGGLGPPFFEFFFLYRPDAGLRDEIWPAQAARRHILIARASRNGLIPTTDFLGRKIVLRSGDDFFCGLAFQSFSLDFSG